MTIERCKKKNACCTLKCAGTKLWGFHTTPTKSPPYTSWKNRAMSEKASWKRITLDLENLEIWLKSTSHLRFTRRLCVTYYYKAVSSTSLSLQVLIDEGVLFPITTKLKLINFLVTVVQSADELSRRWVAILRIKRSQTNAFYPLDSGLPTGSTLWITWAFKFYHTFSSLMYKATGSKFTTGSKTEWRDNEAGSVTCFARSRAWDPRGRRREWRWMMTS